METNEPEVKNQNAPTKSSQLSSPGQLDQYLITITPTFRVALVTLVIICLMTVLWGIFGSIPIKIKGLGIFISHKGLFTVEAKVPGVVKKFFVGDVVKEGQLLIEISDPKEDLKYKTAVFRIENLERDLATLKTEIEKEAKALRESQAKQIASVKYNIEILEKSIPGAEQEMLKKQRLVEEGLLSKSSMGDGRDSLQKKRIDLISLKASLASLEAQLAKGYREEEIRTKEQQILVAKDERDLIALQIEFEKITSPEEGTVLELLLSAGSHVEIGTQLIILEHMRTERENDVVYGFFALDVGKSITLGNEVEIQVSTINPQEFGYIRGKVVEVSPFAVSRKQMEQTIHNQGLVDLLLGESHAVIRIVVEPIADPSTPSGYSWTKGQGPDKRITSGTIGSLKVLTERARPIYYLLSEDAFKISKDSK